MMLPVDMTNFRKRSREEIRAMSVDEFIQYIDEWNKFTETKWANELSTTADEPIFSTVEDARKYYKGITFEEFENRYLKR